MVNVVVGGSYEVLERIGEGSFGEVFRGECCHSSKMLFAFRRKRGREGRPREVFDRVHFVINTLTLHFETVGKFSAFHTKTGVQYAIKREAADHSSPQLPGEVDMLSRLAGHGKPSAVAFLLTDGNGATVTTAVIIRCSISVDGCKWLTPQFHMSSRRLCAESALVWVRRPVERCGVGLAWSQFEAS
jgi:hypothetical protein